MFLFVATLIVAPGQADACTLAPVLAVEDLADPLQGSIAGELENYPGQFLVGLIERMYVKIWPAQAGHTEAYAVATVRFWGQRPLAYGIQISGGQIQASTTSTSCGTEPKRHLGDLFYLAQWDEGYFLPVNADWLTFSQESLLEDVFGPPVEVPVPVLPTRHPQVPDEMSTRSLDTAPQASAVANPEPLLMPVAGLAVALVLLLLLRRGSSR